jgi:hypothetical protein
MTDGLRRLVRQADDIAGGWITGGAGWAGSCQAAAPNVPQYRWWTYAGVKDANVRTTTWQYWPRWSARALLPAAILEGGVLFIEDTGETPVPHRADVDNIPACWRKQQPVFGRFTTERAATKGCDSPVVQWLQSRVKAQVLTGHPSTMWPG